MAELPKDEHFGRLGFLFLGAIRYLPFDLNKRHRGSYETEFPEDADIKPSRHFDIFWVSFWYLFMDVGRITKRAKKVKGGGTRQEINRRGVRVMVSY